jgi:hypothetical protein
MDWTTLIKDLVQKTLAPDGYKLEGPYKVEMPKSRVRKKQIDAVCKTVERLLEYKDSSYTRIIEQLIIELVNNAEKAKEEYTALGGRFLGRLLYVKKRRALASKILTLAAQEGILLNLKRSYQEIELPTKMTILQDTTEEERFPPPQEREPTNDEAGEWFVSQSREVQLEIRRLFSTAGWENRGDNLFRFIVENWNSLKDMAQRKTQDERQEA